MHYIQIKLDSNFPVEVCLLRLRRGLPEPVGGELELDVGDLLLGVVPQRVDPAVPDAVGELGRDSIQS